MCKLGKSYSFIHILNGMNAYLLTHFFRLGKIQYWANYVTHIQPVMTSFQFRLHPEYKNNHFKVEKSIIYFNLLCIFRPRSNTAQWLDKKEQALKKAAKIKVIKWEDSTPLTTDQLAEAFAKFEVKRPEKKKSLLAEQLQNCPNLPHRQYLEYAKFDGTAQLGLPTKSFKIFMTMLPEKYQNYPLVVCVIASAKIKDLIGFTCYKYR